MRTIHLSVARFGALSGVVLLLATIPGTARPAAKPIPQKKEYLSDAEADKIRDAGATGPRIVLYATFAADRIKKLQYEFAHMDPADDKRTDRLNSLINGYSGCIDDAADLLDLGVEKQEDIREGVKMLQARLKEFLPYLQDLAAKGPERETYKDNLEDAIEATQDAMKDLDKAPQELAAPPVRRKPS
jgi:chromosome segregation ATPase